MISGKPIQGLDGRSEVRLSTPGGEVMHSVDVTDAMRRSVLVEGQPLFQKAEEDRGRDGVSYRVEGDEKLLFSEVPAVQENIENGKTTYLIQVTDEHDNTLFIEMSRDGSYWNVNSAGVFRKGYSNKKETVAKTEPQQPTNAVSTGSSLSASEVSGITPAEPNGKPTVSNDKGSENSETAQGKSEKSGEGGDVISGKPIQGLDGRSEEEVLAIVRGHIEEVLSDEGVDGVTQESVRLKN